MISTMARGGSVMTSAEEIRELRALGAELDATIAAAGGDGDTCLSMIRRVQALQVRLRRVRDGLLTYHVQNCLAAVRHGEQTEEPSLQGIREAYCCRSRFAP